MSTISETRLSGLPRCLMLPALLLISGCLSPGMYYGNPYRQPMYAPPQMINPGAPGSLYIPESGQPYVPGGSTYDTDPGDDFEKSDADDQFFDPGNDSDRVPLPSDRRESPFFQEDDLGPSTQSDNPVRINGSAARPVSIARVAGTDIPQEYGFDAADYRWLRGMLRYDPASRGYRVIYSLAGNDSFGGSLSLNVSEAQLNGLSDGDPVDIHGHIDTSAVDGRGRPIYHVEDLRLMSTRLAL